MLGVDGRSAEPSATIEMELERTELPDAFLVQLIHRLRDRGAAAESLLTHIDKLLTASGRTAEDSVRDEQERQVAANATVRNIITSMRHMSDVDWTEIFERVNLVDGVLADGCGFGKWISPPATCIEPRSKSLPGVLISANWRLHAVRFRSEFRPHPKLRKTTGGERIRVITFAAADASSSRPQSAFGQDLK